MFKTKSEVDRHVENCLKKITSETERNLRCLVFAKLYYKVGDYEQARRYVSCYLHAKPLSAEGQCLLGQILEKLGKREAALEAYRASLDLDPKQNNIVVKVCELLASDDVNVDLTGAKYYCERAQAFDPHSPVVFALKEKLIASEAKNPNDFTRFLLTELETRPTDVRLRVRLLKHLLQNNQIKEAYKHASEIEEKNLSIFCNNLSWYEAVAEVLVKYQRDLLDRNPNHEFWILLITVLDKLIMLSIDEHSDNAKNSAECVSAVFNFDQTLAVAAENLVTCSDRQLTQEFLNHFRGQLCFHLATLLYKQAKKGLLQFKDVVNVSLPLLFAAYHAQPLELNNLWLSNASEAKREQLRRWRIEASYRCSQVGHILLAMAKDRKSTVLEKAILHSSGMWREKLFKQIFVTREQHSKTQTSFFVNSQQLVDIVVRLPELSDIVTFDEEAQLVYPNSLHHYIWLGMNVKLSEFKCTALEGLQYSVRSLGNCAAESLNILDIQAFLYCATVCAQEHIRARHHSYPKEKPPVLPASITEQLGTLNQLKWLDAAYKMYKREYGSDFGDIRLTLIKGIEVIRCIGNHGLDVKLLVILANTFAERAKVLTKQSEIEFNEARAELYWKTALPLLEKLKNNQVCMYKGQRMFEYKSKEIPLTEIYSYIDSAKLFLATQLLKQKEYEKALPMLEHLKDPFASYYQAQIYKNMADDYIHQNKDPVTLEMQNHYIILLNKSKDSLYLTLDRLREPSVDRNHPLNAKLANEIEKIERAILKADPLTTNRNECDGMSDENESSNSSTDRITYSYSHLNSSYLNGSLLTRAEPNLSFSTPLKTESYRREARPSPERLDAQLRQLAASKDAAISHILEQNRVMVESHRGLVDELRGFKDAVNSLTSAVGELQNIKHTVEELRGIKDSVNELKTSVDELQNFRNVTDMVYEMKKEISELKKDGKVKNTQLSDEDLYPLDDEFGADYNIAPTVPGFNSNVYQNYQGRIPGANSLAYPQHALYPGMYPMTYYGLGLPQPGALPFAPDLSADLRVMNTISQNLTQQGLPQPAYGQPLLPPTLQPPFSQPALATPTIPPPNLMTGQALTQQQLFKDSPLNTSNTAPQLFKDSPLSSSNAAAVTTPSSAANANVFSSIKPPTFSTSVPSVINVPSSKAPPVNVVITSSDPLPTNKTPVSQPVLSVTIPPQHLKGNLPPKSQPHSYQIALPSTTVSTVSSTPSVLAQPPLPVSTQSILFNVAPPIYSAIADKTPNKNTSLGLQIEKTLSDSFSSPSLKDSKADLNKSNRSNTSVSSVEEHDPCPDFKPIVPLPDEVPVNTGEEKENVLFCERAKLFRYGDKEWKERGVGSLKILQNKETGKIRILMRRDQVHKICANHFLTKDMTLTPMPKTDKAYIWAANDFSDNEMVLEKLCVRFKTVDEAAKFCRAFEEAKLALKDDVNDNKQPTDSKKTENASIKAAVSVSSTKTVEKLNTSQPQTSLGGFVFASTPTFKPKEELIPDKIEKEEAPKSSPFADFSFGSKTTNATSTPLLFGAIQSDFKPVQSPQTVSTPKASDAAKITPSSPDDQSATEFVPTAEFKPVVPLPAIVDVKTGEENAEVLFEMRGKLLRYEASTKEWKERGIGQIKILKENNTVRLLMRREQVHKVCCNHQLLKSMNFKKMPTSPKAVSWYAQDFSEEVLKPEMFVARFKTDEQADEFLKAVTAAQESLNESNVIGENVAEKKAERNQHAKFKTDTEVKDVSPKPTHGFGDKFKPKSGSWECKNCYISNEAKDNYCVACETPKIDSSVAQKHGSCTQLLADQGFPSTFGDKFKPKPGSWQCQACLINNDPDKTHCVACDTPKDDTVPKKEPSKGVNLDTPGLKFSFGIPPSVGSQMPQTPAKTPETLAVDPKPFAFTWGAGSVENQTVLEEENKDKFVFGSPQKHSFEFTPRSPRRHSGGQGDDESDGSYVEEEGDNIYFKPVVPLPDKVDVKTGEEQEEVLYCHRAKLFRYTQGEWKERGIGDVKILFKPDTKKLRVVMRREQVLKICLNHVLTPDIQYLPKDEKTWLFHAADFSEGEISRDQFCVRFKTAEIAQEFKKAVADALERAGDKHDVKTESAGGDSDIEIVSETQVSAEDEKEAKRLGLPPKFLSYKQLPDCVCDQCKKDDEYLTDLLKKDTPSAGTPKSVFGTSQSSSIFTTPSSLFGTPPIAVSPFNVSNKGVFAAGGDQSSQVPTPDKNKRETLKELLIKPPVFDVGSKATEQAKTPSKTSESSVFKNFSFTLSTTANQTPTNSIFSNTPTTKSTTESPFSFGSGSSIFGANAVKPTATVGSVFGTAFTSSGSLFSSPAPTPSNPTPSATAPTNSRIFGANSTTTISSGIFGSNPSVTTTNSGIFGSNSSVTTTNSGIFGSVTTTTASSGIFGSVTTTSSGIFGSVTTTSSGIFGSVTTTSSGIFGSVPASNTTTNSGIFGANSTATKSGMFGSSAPSFGGGGVFGAGGLESKTPSPGAFFGGNSQPLSFGSLIQEKEGEKSIEDVLRCDTNLSFAALAATNPDKPAFASAAADDKNSFAFLGAGTPVFGGAKPKGVKKTEDKDKSQTEEGEVEGGDEEYDPHYEPIVPLPDAIVVSTGEEEEDVLFNDRGKLYRYDADNKEWKERGVGQIKLLHHPVNNTYRLLLRREQVHKLVLNQLVTPDLELQPMTTSDKAWLWGGHNYTDDQLVLEKLAARFKTTEIANHFYETVSKAIAAVRELQEIKNVPSTVQNYGLEDVSGDENNSQPIVEQPEDDEDDEDEDDDDDDDDDKSIMFTKRCTLSEQTLSGEWNAIAMGEIQVLYDPELYGARICMNADNGETVSNTIIGINTVMTNENNSCWWKAVEWANDDVQLKTLKATFSSGAAAEEFYMSYQEGVNYAQECDIVDELPMGQPGDTSDSDPEAN